MIAAAPGSAVTPVYLTAAGGRPGGSAEVVGGNVVGRRGDQADRGSVARVGLENRRRVADRFDAIARGAQQLGEVQAERGVGWGGLDGPLEAGQERIRRHVALLVSGRRGLDPAAARDAADMLPAACGLDAAGRALSAAS
jgi:hypothetical protein